MKTPELKPCPFCGSEAKMWFKPGDNEFYVECRKCHVRTDGMCMNTHAEDAPEAMIDCMEMSASDWNRRVTDA